MNLRMLQRDDKQPTDHVSTKELNLPSRDRLVTKSRKAQTVKNFRQLEKIDDLQAVSAKAEASQQITNIGALHKKLGFQLLLDR